MDAGVKKRGERNKLVITWTGPWRVVFAASSQLVDSVKDFSKGEHKEANVAQISPYADESLALTVELVGVSTKLKNQGEFQMQAIRAVAISADNDSERVVQVKWADVDMSEMA